MSTTLRSASVLMLSTLIIVSTLAFAQAGQLDASFGQGGVVTTDFGNRINTNIATANAVTIQPDGKILVCGGMPSPNDFPVAVVARYNTDGTLDTTFGSAGLAVTTDLAPPGAIVLQSDGKIVVSGPDGGLEISVARYTTSGVLDTTFGTHGIYTSGIHLGGAGTSNVIIQPDGKILVGQGLLLRLLSDGTVDSDFGVSGFATVAGGVTTSMALLANGKILLGAASPFQGATTGFITRYSSTGALDTTFGINGQLASAGPADGMALLSSGEFVVAGTLTVSVTGLSTGFAVSRNLGFGFPDAKFGVHGGTVTAIPNYSTVAATGLGIQASGDAITFGLATENFSTLAFALARYTPTGQLDTTFGSNGTVTTALGTTSLTTGRLAIQADGKIVVVAGYTMTALHGDFDTGFKIARYLGE